MATTPRNNIICQPYCMLDLAYVDTLYEIADDELNSMSHVHDKFQQLKKEFRKVDGKFAQFLHSEVFKIAQRNDLVKYASWHVCDVVAKKIAHTWVQRDRAVAFHRCPA